MNDTTLQELEDWWQGVKGRYVRMGVDTTYGATCWEVTLGNVNIRAPSDWELEGRAKEQGWAEIYAGETFFLSGNSPPNIVACNDGQDYEKAAFPGLSETIKLAIKTAKEFGL